MLLLIAIASHSPFEKFFDQKLQKNVQAKLNNILYLFNSTYSNKIVSQTITCCFNYRQFFQTFFLQFSTIFRFFLITKNKNKLNLS